MRKHPKIEEKNNAQIEIIYHQIMDLKELIDTKIKYLQIIQANILSIQVK